MYLPNELSETSFLRKKVTFYFWCEIILKIYILLYMYILKQSDICDNIVVYYETGWLVYEAQSKLIKSLSSSLSRCILLRFIHPILNIHLNLHSFPILEDSNRNICPSSSKKKETVQTKRSYIVSKIINFEIKRF